MDGFAIELLANMAAFSEDLRARVVDAVENEKMSVRDAADRFKVGKSWVSKILVRFRQTGDAGAFLPIGVPLPNSTSGNGAGCRSGSGRSRT